MDSSLRYSSTSLFVPANNVIQVLPENANRHGLIVSSDTPNLNGVFIVLEYGPVALTDFTSQPNLLISYLNRSIELGSISDLSLTLNASGGFGGHGFKFKRAPTNPITIATTLNANVTFVEGY